MCFSLSRLAIAALTILVLIGSLGLPATAQDGSLTAGQKDAVDARIRAYLLENPELIMEALEVLEQRQKLAAEEKARAQLAARRDDLVNDPASPVGWNPDGDVTIVEFFDYQCPYCKAVTPALTALRNQDAGIRYVYKEWPILGPVSQIAARAALAAEKQDLYEAMHEAMIGFSGRLTENDIFALAERVGLDVERLRRDMTSPEIDEALQRNAELAKAIGVSGTPAFVIGDKLLPGAADIEQMKAMIAEARQRS